MERLKQKAILTHVPATNQAAASRTATDAAGAYSALVVRKNMKEDLTRDSVRFSAGEGPPLSTTSKDMLKHVIVDWGERNHELYRKIRYKNTRNVFKLQFGRQAKLAEPS